MFRVTMLAAVVLVAMLGGGQALYAVTAPPDGQCGFGPAISERVLLRPASGTFYSVDALGPDVVRFRGRWLLFFSGNSVRTDAGYWYSGLMTAPRITGPWRIDRRVKLPWLDGGSAVFRGRLYTLATAHNLAQRPVLYESSDARHWRLVSRVPLPPPGPLKWGEVGTWRSFIGDMFLRAEPGGLAAYYAARSGPNGADIGSATWRNGRWGTFRVALRRSLNGWDRLDLGAPAVFRDRGRMFMLYVGLGANNQARDIGLAVRSHGVWRRCGDGPFIRAGRRWYSANAIDPSPVLVGPRLYMFFGGGIRASLGGDMSGTIGVRIY